jgi:hypothetical protein
VSGWRALLRFAEIAQQAADQQSDSRPDQGSKGPKKDGADQDARDLGVEGGRGAGGSGDRFWQRRHGQGLALMAVVPEHYEKHVNLSQNEADDGKGFGEISAWHKWRFQQILWGELEREATGVSSDRERNVANRAKIVLSQNSSDYEF